MIRTSHPHTFFFIEGDVLRVYAPPLRRDTGGLASIPWLEGAFEKGEPWVTATRVGIIYTLVWTLPLYELHVSRIRRIVLPSRWPRLEIHYRGNTGITEVYAFHDAPWSGIEPEPGSLPLAHARVAEQLATWAVERGLEVDQGWLRYPEVRFDAVKMPGRDDTSAARVGYRDSARSSPWRWTAPPSSSDRLWRWLVERLRRRWPYPDEAATNGEDVFVRFGDEAKSIPLGALRGRVDEGDDALYLFGRNAQLRLPGGRQCDVRKALDAALDGETNATPFDRG